MTRRYHSSVAVDTTIPGGTTNVATSIVIAAATGLPASYPYTMIIDDDTTTMEAVEVTNRSGTTLTVTRGVDGTTAQSHSAGATIHHGWSARDLDEPNAWINAGHDHSTTALGGAVPQSSVTSLVSDLAAKAASPTFTLINAGGTALTGATTVTVSGISAKNWLLIRVDGASSASVSSYISLQFNGDTASNYSQVGLIVSNAVAASALAVSTVINLGRMGTAAADTVSAQLILHGTKAAGIMPLAFGSSTSAATGDARSSVGHYVASAAITSVTVISSVGNFDAGTIYVYGA